MDFLRRLRPSRSAEARRALDERRLDAAEKLYLEIIQSGSASPADFWNLGLVYKFQKRWRESREAFVRYSEVQPTPEAFWNAGLAATALRDWRTARWAWRRLDFDVGSEDGPPEANFGIGPIRLNPQTEPEVVWGARIDPCRMRIKSVPLPPSGHRFDDVVLHDVVPAGTRMLGDREVPVFEELERMDASPYPTLQADLSWATPADERELIDLIGEVGMGAENWSSSVQMLCARCDLTSGHVHGNGQSADEVTLTGTWGFGGDANSVRSVLVTWVAHGDGRTTSDLKEAESS